jgi:cellulose synthase/poly-beta-1,6-N-acetylglucosamine synthase-like glycosyltransferase
MQNINPYIAVITPTYKRNGDIIKRCLTSVAWQIKPNNLDILQIVCSDGPKEDHACSIVEEIQEVLPEHVKLVYDYTAVNTNSYGGGVRHHVMNNILADDIQNDVCKFIIHLDDDNLLFPDFVKKNIDILNENPDSEFSVCKILHLGPLPSHLGNAPQVISGVPPVFQNIDTLQVVVRAKSMMECGWDHFIGEKGYYNDGYTYDRLGKMFKYVQLPELLAIHV